MLSGELLGKALREAIKLKGVKPAAVARHFGVKPPSVYDWLNHGRLDKRHINNLVEYFSDVVGPAHWGLPNEWPISASGNNSSDIAAQHRTKVAPLHTDWGDGEDAELPSMERYLRETLQALDPADRLKLMDYARLLRGERPPKRLKSKKSNVRDLGPRAGKKAA